MITLTIEAVIYRNHVADAPVDPETGEAPNPEVGHDVETKCFEWRVQVDEGASSYVHVDSAPTSNEAESAARAWIADLVKPPKMAAKVVEPTVLLFSDTGKELVDEESK